MMNSIPSDISNLLSEKTGLPLYAGEIVVAIFFFILAFVIGWIVYAFFEKYVKKLASKTKTKLDDLIIENVKMPIYLLILLIGLYFAITSLSFIERYKFYIDAVFTIAEIFLVAFVIARIFNVLIGWYAERREKKGREVSKHLLFVFKKLIQGTVALFALLAILSAFHIDLSGVVVGLGIGGLAIGLALQNVLQDIFSAFTIYFDRPFEIGDFIVIGEYMGTVKKIGIKSTRVQLLQGEELVVSNRELTNREIRNFKRMEKRRVVFTIGVTYDTPLEKLKKIPEIIKDIIDPKKLPDVDQLERVHFKEFGPYSLNFEIVYYMKTRDYIKYMDTQQTINFRIKEEFEKEGIEMAFPTQTIYINK